MSAGYRKDDARATRKETKQKERFGMPLARFVEDADIPQSARLIYTILACRANGRSGVANISISELARRSGYGVSTTKSAIRLLKAVGAVERLSRERASGVWKVKIGGGGDDGPSRENGSRAFARNNISRAFDQAAKGGS